MSAKTLKNIQQIYGFNKHLLYFVYLKRNFCTANLHQIYRSAKI